MEQAPEQTKPALQRAIEIVSEERLKSSLQEPGSEAEEEDNDKNGDDDKAAPTPVQPNQNQHSSPKTEDEAESTPVQPKQIQLSPQQIAPPFSNR